MLRYIFLSGLLLASASLFAQGNYEKINPGIISFIKDKKLSFKDSIKKIELAIEFTIDESSKNIQLRITTSKANDEQYAASVHQLSAVKLSGGSTVLTFAGDLLLVKPGNQEYEGSQIIVLFHEGRFDAPLLTWLCQGKKNFQIIFYTTGTMVVTSKS